MADTSSDGCPRCGKPVTCGMKAGMTRCWCADFPPVLKVPALEQGAGCYCPECLREIVEAARAGEVSGNSGPG